jgi:hypothetical protein
MFGAMTLDEVMQELEALGTEQTKMTFMRHGAMEPVFGVRIGDMKNVPAFQPLFMPASVPPVKLLIAFR